MNKQNLTFRVLKGIARWVDRVRRFLHLILMLFLLLLVSALLAPPRPVVPARAALVVSPQGVLVEELSGDPFERALALAQGLGFRETLLADLIEAIDMAAGDDRIRALVLDLDGLTGSGLSKLQELAVEIERFRDSGKPVYAVGSIYQRDQYYLAAHADEIFLHPMGLVLIDGYSTFMPYYKSALDKLYIDYNTWTAGEYKSLFEAQTRDDMSPADREARSAYLSALWQSYQRDVEAARGLEADSLQRYADQFEPLLSDAGGDAAELAVTLDLVDETLYSDEIAARIRDVVDAASDSDSGYSGIDHRDYLAAIRAVHLPEIESRKIGLIVASGEILDGVQAPGTVGAESITQRIRAAREDEAIRALVLRIDSPGGSAMASERILRELDLFRETGRPLVVSMGSVAASGGYWIAMGADEIWASESSLTGSIGVGSAVVTFDRALAQLGVSIDGIGTTELAGQMDPMRGLGDDIAAYLQLSVEQTYETFVTHIAERRAMDVADVYASAEGRVWIGSEAQRRGLVDRLGGLEQAIESAAGLADLAPGSYAVDKLEPELGWAETFALQMVRVAAPVLPAVGIEPVLPAALERLIDAAAEPLRYLERFNDPRGIYALCFCDVD